LSHGEDIVPDSWQLRHALGKFATGVAVVTTIDDAGAPIGLTINSFSSVSLDPPLVLWSLTRRSPNLAHFSTAEKFAINILNRDQSDISRRFSMPVSDRFCDVSWQPGINGMPLLCGSVATFECQTERLTDGGDHVVFFGKVLDHRQEDLEPLLFFAGRYGTANLAV
jgi:3-hydroxy-9,10-secoandrosta-1,3,5(10)-triene-9,17-dione monooxygenase reductase component